MIILMIAETRLKSLDKDKANIVSELLGLKHPPDYSDFFDAANPQYNTDDPRDFYHFFYDVLVEQNALCAINFDWKWHPDDVFWRLKEYLPTYDIELLETKDDPDYLAYEIAYRIGASTATIKVNFSELVKDSLSNLVKLEGVLFFVSKRIYRTVVTLIKIFPFIH